MGDAAGAWNFLVAFREASWNFPRQDHDSKEFRAFAAKGAGLKIDDFESPRIRCFGVLFPFIEGGKAPYEATARIHSEMAKI